jgi:hypothetical protein
MVNLFSSLCDQDITSYNILRLTLFKRIITFILTHYYLAKTSQLKPENGFVILITNIKPTGVNKIVISKEYKLKNIKQIQQINNNGSLNDIVWYLLILSLKQWKTDLSTFFGIIGISIRESVDIGEMENFATRQVVKVKKYLIIYQIRLNT